MRRFVATCVCMVLVACGGQPATTTTAPDPVGTSSEPVVETTTSVPPETTTPTTTVAPTTTIESEVPAELLALIGAPMPEVDLTIEGSEDVERWLQEFLKWEEWTAANPEQGFETLTEFAAGQYLEGRSQGLPRLLEAGVVSVGGGLLVRRADANLDDVTVGVLTIVFETTQAGPIYTLSADNLTVVHVDEPSGSWVTVDAVLLMDEEGRWIPVEFASR